MKVFELIDILNKVPQNIEVRDVWGSTIVRAEFIDSAADGDDQESFVEIA